MSEPLVLDPVVIDGLRNLTPPGEPDVLGEVLQMFLTEVPPRIVRLRIALAAGNIEEVHRAAHSLKGSAGNIGAQALHAVCKQLDEQGRSGDLSGAGHLIERLGTEFARVETEIRRLMDSGGANRGVSPT
jgi:HPt (histidine-containing phosphotransfer) domain-containing protein